VQGSQTLLRGLDMIEGDRRPDRSPNWPRAGPDPLTTHRLAAALVDRGFLTFLPRDGYQLGPKLDGAGLPRPEPGRCIVQIARPFMEELPPRPRTRSISAVLDGEQALYLDKIPGRRRVEIEPDRRSPAAHVDRARQGPDPRPGRRALEEAVRRPTGAARRGLPVWLERMRGYAAAGRAFDLEENEDQIRCVAAPIRDVDGKIVAAISVSSAAQYMDDARMESLSEDVRDTAPTISRELGWSERSQAQAR
jgi:DNA-binding IclR family transcriptional regulator